MKVESLYLHMGWGMSYPFSPRTWSLEEWQRWLALLESKGVKRLMLWPGLEFVDVDKDDEIFRLRELLTWISSVCSQLNLEFWCGRSLNTILSEAGKSKVWEERDVRDCEYVSIQRGEYVDAVLNPLAQMSKGWACDGWWVIDRDPGDSLGSTPKDFAVAVREMIDVLDCKPKPIYWMWGGWSDKMGQEQGWQEVAQPFWEEAIQSLYAIYKEDLCLLQCWEGHRESNPYDTLNCYDFPYHEFEPEPSLPFTSNNIEKEYQRPLRQKNEIVFNIQTPCLRTANIGLGSKDVSWRRIADHWCWDIKSLDELEVKWTSLCQKLEGGEVTQADVHAWIEYTGAHFPSKRGLLHEVLCR